MAINIDHTNSAIITLRGPSNASVSDTINFVFPNTQSSSASLLLSLEKLTLVQFLDWFQHWEKK